MSSGSRKMWDIEKEREHLHKEEEQLIFLNQSAQNIQAIEPFSQDFSDWKFILENKEKIIRNRQVIELLG